MRRLTVLIADDHTMVLEGLVRLLEEHDFEVTGTVGDGNRLIELALQLRPDVIVTDVSMPGLSGLEALSLLKAQHVNSKVIILTMHDDPDMAARALRAGASGYVLKDLAGEDLVGAILQVLQGRVYLAPALMQGVMERMAEGRGTSGPALTPRQRQVLRLLMEGRRMKEIAAALDLSTRTVESHKYAMMETLGVQSTAELVKYAIEHRLLLD
jgi:DNA-binding NarL/FixJ family response regulator